MKIKLLPLNHFTPMIKLTILPLTATALVLGLCTSNAATTLVTKAWSGAAIIPDGDANGIVTTVTLNTGTQTIASLELRLVTTGGWNGDLYAYLEHNGVMCVLLNRPGVTAPGESGSPAPGLNITLADDASTDSHTGIIGTSTQAVTGRFQPDARAADPAVVLDTSPRTLYFSGFTDEVAEGDWTLFIADLSATEEATLASWTLDATLNPAVAAIPEPTGVLTLIGLICSASFLRTRRMGSTREE